MTAVMNRPLPEMLGRNDGQTYGEWLVENCPPSRGLPVTSVEGRIMRAPMADDPLSVAIRAHEMVHAKVSPMGDDMTKWLSRGRASMDALVACEELRVNHLASLAGFDMSVLFDGSEESTGERCVAMNSWDSAVQFAIATAGTGGHKKFLTGVRRHNRTWATVLADIAKRAVKDMKSATKRGTGDLANTSRDMAGLGPIGFAHTERLAEWIDRLCENAPKPKDKDEDSKSGDGTSGDSETIDDSDKPKKRGRKPVDKDDKDEADDAVKDSRRVNPVGSPGYVETTDWFPLKVEKCPMPTVLSGHMGKKRVASISGKSPRRLHRLLTDPERRVFDRVIRGKGGVVVFDGSGSMRVSPAEVKRVVEAAPGATVFVYTTINQKMNEDGTPTTANCWMLSHKGRMIDEMPYETGRGNGVDLPALRHAMTYRHRSTTPFVWVSDGMVTGHNDTSTDELAMDTYRYVVKNNILVAPDAESAITMLGKLTTGQTVKTQWSDHMRYVWRNAMGSLPYAR